MTKAFFSNTLSQQEWAFPVHIDNGPNEARLDVDGLDIDAQGNVYITGYFQGVLSTLSSPISSTQVTIQNTTTYTKDLFLMKLNKQGRAQTLLHIPTTGFAGNGFDLAVDRSDGSIYISGGFSGSLNFNKKSLTADCAQGTGLGSNAGTQGQMFLLKLDKTGALKWGQQANSKAIVSGGNEISLDAKGRILQIGLMGLNEQQTTQGCDPKAAKELLVGTHRLAYGGGVFDTFISVTDPQTGEVTGRPVMIGGAGQQRGKAIDKSVDKDGQPTLIFGIDITGPTTITDTQGQEQLKTTTTKETGLTGANAFSKDMLVGRMTYKGKLLWSHVLGSKNDKVLSQGKRLDEIKGVATDSQGHTIVAGTSVGDLYMDGKLILATKTLDPKATSIGFVAKYDKDTGALIWVRGIGSNGNVFTCCEIVIDDRDRIYLTPQIQGGTSVVFGDQFKHNFDSQSYTSKDKIGMIVQLHTTGKLLSIRSLPHAATGTQSTTSELAAGPDGLFWTGTLFGAIKLNQGTFVSGADKSGRKESETIVRYIYPN